MPTLGAIGRKQREAENRLASAMQRIADAVNVPPVEARPKGRNPAFVQAQRLEAFATWAEQIADVVSEGGAKPGVQTLTDAPSPRLVRLRDVLTHLLRMHTKADLEAFAEDFGLDLGDARTKDDYLSALLAQLTGLEAEAQEADG